MRLNASWFGELKEEAQKLRSPALPVGIFLVAILSIAAYRDRAVSSFLKPRIEPLSEFLGLSPDCLYAFLVLFLVPIAFLAVTRQNLRQYGPPSCTPASLLCSSCPSAPGEPPGGHQNR